MGDSVFVAKDQDGSWNAGAVIRVRKYPEYVSEQAMISLLAACDAPETSCEIVLENAGERNGNVDTRLILRQRGSQPSTLRPAAEHLTERIRERLEFDGAEVTVLEKEEALTWGDSLGERQTVLLCMPAEDLRRITCCYVPGGYDALYPLDLPYLYALLRRFPGSGISLQMIRTAYSQPEYELIQNLSDQGMNPGHPESREVARVYGWYQTMGEHPLFLTTVTIWGPDECLRSFVDCIRGSRLQIMDIPSGQWYQQNYLVSGDRILPEYAILRGHVTGDMPIPAAGRRLNYLTIPQCLNELVKTALGRARLAGIERQSGEQSAEEVPEQYLADTGVKLGVAMGREQEVYLPVERLVKHAVIAGMPGSGKTSMMFWLLAELAKKKIPFLIFEPTKTEYRELIGVIPNLKVLTPGRVDVSPVMFNPFLPPAEVTLEQYLPSLETAFQTAFSMPSPMDVIMKDVLQSCYAKYGWRSTSTRESAEAKVFGMHEFVQAYREAINQSSYDDESKGNLLSGGAYRLESLINSNRYMFDTDRSMAVDELLSGHTLIELDAIDNPEQKSLFLSLLLLQLKLVIRKKQQQTGTLKNVIFIDEAHVLLGQKRAIRDARDADPVGAAVSFLQDMVLVNRAYGTGMVFADQSVEVLSPFVDNAETKMIFHLEKQSERRYLAENLNLSEPTAKKIAKLDRGEFCLTAPRVNDALFVLSPDSKRLLNLASHVDDETIAANVRAGFPRPFEACPCTRRCSLEIRTEAEFIARKLADSRGDMIRDPERLENFLRRNLRDAVEEYTTDHDDEERLIKCACFLAERAIRAKASSVQS